MLVGPGGYRFFLRVSRSCRRHTASETGTLPTIYAKYPRPFVSMFSPIVSCPMPPSPHPSRAHLARLDRRATELVEASAAAARRSPPDVVDLATGSAIEAGGFQGSKPSTSRSGVDSRCCCLGRPPWHFRVGCEVSTTRAAGAFAPLKRRRAVSAACFAESRPLAPTAPPLPRRWRPRWKRPPWLNVRQR